MNSIPDTFLNLFIFFSLINGIKYYIANLLISYEVPLGQREEIKRKYQNFTRNQVALPRNELKVLYMIFINFSCKNNYYNSYGSNVICSGDFLNLYNCLCTRRK